MTAQQIREKLENPATNEEFFEYLPYIFDKKFAYFLDNIYSDCLTYAFVIYPHTKFKEKKVSQIKNWDSKTVESLFYPIVSKDQFLPDFQCIKIEKNWIVSTDKHILCRTKNQTNLAKDVYRLNKIVKLATTENLIGNSHPLWPEKFNFPNYEQVIPEINNAEEIKKVKVLELYNYLFYYLKYKIQLHTGNLWAKAGFYGKVDIHFDAKKMLTVLEFILKASDNSCKIYFYANNKPIRLISETCDCIIMPIMYDNETVLDCTKFLI